MELKYWKVKTLPLKGHKYEDVLSDIDIYLKLYRGGGRRKPYIRSRLFNKQKIFFDYFWEHLFAKPLKQRKQRMKLIPCGLELLGESTIVPTLKIPGNRSSLKAEKLFRCLDEIQDGRTFVVQIKQTKNGNLQLISMFWKEK